uniref:Bee-milk protein n=1 Tax=Graphocephala atropunctata TaxID=36148 RepID=A0A1B6M0S0_9HEMI
MYGESHGISWTDLNIDDRLPPLLTQMYMDVFSIDYHYQRRCLFYSGWGNIWSWPIEPGGCKDVPRLVVEGGGVKSLAVDWVRDVVYWTLLDNRTVWRADLTGNNSTVVLSNTGNLARHDNLVLDPYSRFLFLAADGDHFLRSDLEGEGLKRVTIEGGRNIRVVSLALDTGARRLYLSVRWDHLPHILSCGYDGSRVQDYQLTGEWWNSFVSIGVLKDQLFWAHRGWVEGDHDTVWKAKVLGGGNLTWLKEYTAPGSFLGPITTIWTLKVYHPSIQMPREETWMISSAHQRSAQLLLTVATTCLWNMINYNNIIQ